MEIRCIAKYLPIDGKIKSGEIFLDSCTGLYYIADVISKKCIITASTDGYDVPLKDCQKVKLFAVTYDLEIGDYVQCDDSVKPILLDNVTFTVEMLLKGHWFKALGEISEEAKWVIQGDEIEIMLVRKWKYSKWQKNKIALVLCENCKTHH